MGKFIDLTGQKFGRLTVVSFSSKDKNHHLYWNCVCECGTNRRVAGCALKRGLTQSCGCLSREKASFRAKQRQKTEQRLTRKTHGLKHCRLYGVWSDIKKRCNNPNSHIYKHYGGRGISICDEWSNNFKAFYDWAMANGYDENAQKGECTIDRIDVNGNYEPSNCRWVSMEVQAKNKSTNHYLEMNGEKHTISDWSRILNIPSARITARLKLGWTEQEALRKDKL